MLVSFTSNFNMSLPKQIKKFILRTTLFLSPMFFLILLFFIFDPFYMIHHKMKWAKASSSGNADFTTLNTFKKNNDSLHFNAFIFGNSKALGFISPHWKKYIGDSPGELKL